MLFYRKSFLLSHNILLYKVNFNDDAIVDGVVMQ